MDTGHIAGPARRWCALALALATGLAPAHGQERHAVGLELVLLVDGSASVDDGEFRLQTDGLSAAFASTAVRAAIRTLAPLGMAVCVVQWADHAQQYKSVDWTVLRRDADALSLAGKIAAMPRLTDGGQTAIGNALGFALNQIRSNGYAGLRRVIDVSGDGRANDGRPLRTARRAVLDHGITINGLAILNELPHLDKYFRSHLIGGEGAFVMTATDYTDFASAMRHKLEREIGSVPVTNNVIPDTIPGAIIEARAEGIAQWGDQR
ncbi:MAG: DUF1194 domain-containing protein [Alphaproteobacteria bacterium]